MSAPDALLVISNLPHPQAAEELARGLIEAGLAGCVNVLPGCRSFYHWQGELRQDHEVPVLIKTTVQLYPALQAYIVQHHPYELPEIIALRIDTGLPAYLDWLAAQCGAPAGVELRSV